MKIACIGTGFVGVVTAVVFAHLGHKVVGLDIDQNKIALLKQSRVPFFEPELQELLKKTQDTGNLTFTTDYSEAISKAEVIFIMVGTPSATDGTADLKYLFSAVESLAPHLSNGAIIVIKSTVPPGTNHKLKQIIAAKTKTTFDIASVPEFLKEGTAVRDTLHPDRILIGSTNPATAKLLHSLHLPLTNQILDLSPESAQMAKYAANVYLAMRITFANQIADLCEQNGADIEEVLRGIGADSRIGSHYWYPGLGYGGSCFPKDVKEIAAYAKSVGEHDSIFIAVDERNETRIPRLLKHYSKLMHGFAGKQVTLLGTSFKPNTDDTREAPAGKLLPLLQAQKAHVVTCDPMVKADFTDPYKAVQDSHAVFLLVEWPEYKSLDLQKIAAAMKSPRYFFDTRNQYSPNLAFQAGLKYQGVGRG